MKTAFDRIIFTPNDVDLNYSPIRKCLKEETFVLGAFNPGMTRLPNGNLLLMVRVAEALQNSVVDDKFRAIRWSKKDGYVIDEIPLEKLDTSDPRKYIIKNYVNKTYCLTSSSWLLPVELNEDGSSVIQVHYDKIIQPEETYQEFGIEDARITKIEDIYYMTACSVSSERHSTILYSSKNGLEYNLHGIILDHQNKDMVLFPKKINGYYYALTRPTGDHYFVSNLDSENIPGPSTYMAQSPDLLHWKPVEDFILKPRNKSMINLKIGGGAPPIEIDEGWLVVFHGVENKNNVGIYRSFVCLLEKENLQNILNVNYEIAFLESDSTLTAQLNLNKYISDVVFTSGIDEDKDNIIIASGELDLCCRITHVNKENVTQYLNE